MPTSDPLLILLRHNRWATRNMLEACLALTAEQFSRPFEMGPGSLQATLTHVLAATQVWEDFLAGREARPRMDQDGVQRTAAHLLELAGPIHDQFEAAALAYPVDAIVTGMRRGRMVSMARGAVLTHVTTHAMHHRAQCLNMLRHVGVRSLPPSSVLEWVLTVDMADQVGS